MKIGLAFGLCLLTSLCMGCAPLQALTSLLPHANGSTPPLTATTVELKEANYTVLKYNVVGQSTGFSLLGIITIVPSSRVKAFTRMYQNAGVRPGDLATPAHIVVDESDPYFILFSLPKVNVRADFVVFHEPTKATESTNKVSSVVHN